MKARFQFRIDPDLRKRAQAKADALGISFSEYVQRLVASDLGETKHKPKAKADISIVFDLGVSGAPTNIARDKDRMIGEAVWKEYLRSTGRTRRAGRTNKSRHEDG
jgi:hypothetical protein